MGTALIAVFALHSLLASCNHDYKPVVLCQNASCSEVQDPIAVSPSPLTFGDVNVGGSSSRDVALTNNGSDSVTITELSVTGAGFTGSGLAVPVTLAPVESRTFAVAFSPQAPGDFTGEVALAMAGPRPRILIPSSGKGVQASPPPPPPPVSGPVVAYPGASGGGAQSVGGRGGRVVLVTNTADGGAGSLRACVEASGPRTCVFRTGGTIALASTLAVANPYVTIAGQTAPGGGIQLRGPNSPGDPALMVTTHDVVVQYLRVRRGHNPGEICNQNPWSCGASLEIFSGAPGANPYNIMLDHLSAEWSNYDAVIGLGSNNTTTQPRSLTISNSIIGEALGGAGQAVGANFSGYSGQGSTVPDGMTDLDLHHNLFAGGTHRMPIMTVRSARLVNNIVYAWTYYAMRGKGLRDIVNNYFKTRTGQSPASHEVHAWTENAGNDTSLAPSFYLIGNLGPSDPTGTNNWSMTGLASSGAGPEASSPLAAVYQRGSPMPTPAGYVPIPADPASTISSAAGPMLNTARAAPYQGVGASRKLGCNGEWQDALDPVDSRIVNAVANGTNLYGAYDYSSVQAAPQSQADLGGWPTLAPGTPCPDGNGNGLPDAWESHWAGVFGLAGVLDPNALDFADGYTNLEHYLAGTHPSP